QCLAASVHYDRSRIATDSMLTRESLALALILGIELEEHRFPAKRGDLRVAINVLVHPLAPPAPVGVYVDDHNPVSVRGAAQRPLQVILPGDLARNRSRVV